MRYTVSSGDVVIGETGLGFARTGLPVRAGWLHPNAEGERLLPHVVAPLALHRPDGSVVPTRMLAIQDVHQLVALAEWEEARREAQGWSPVDDALDALFAVDDPDDDAADLLAGEAPLDGDPAQPGADWAPDDEPTEPPRYQVVLELADGDAIP